VSLTMAEDCKSADWDPMTPAELANVAYLREKLGDRFKEIPWDSMVQFIRGYISDKPKDKSKDQVTYAREETLKRVTTMINWRKEVQVHNVLERQDEDDEAWQHYFMGYSDDGRPVFLVKVGAISASRLAGLGDDATHVRVMARRHELGRISAMNKSGELQNRKYKQIMIVDLHGLGIMGVGKLKPYGGKVGFLSDIYPDSLYKLFIVNAPGWINTVINIAKGMLHPVTAQKFNVVKDPAKELPGHGLGSITVPKGGQPVPPENAMHVWYKKILQEKYVPRPFIPPEEVAALKAMGINPYEQFAGVEHEGWVERPRDGAEGDEETLRCSFPKDEASVGVHAVDIQIQKNENSDIQLIDKQNPLLEHPPVPQVAAGVAPGVATAAPTPQKDGQTRQDHERYGGPFLPPVSVDEDFPAYPLPCCEQCCCLRPCGVDTVSAIEAGARWSLRSNLLLQCVLLLLAIFCLAEVVGDGANGADIITLVDAIISLPVLWYMLGKLSRDFADSWSCIRTLCALLSLLYFVAVIIDLAMLDGGKTVMMLVVDLAAFHAWCRTIYWCNKLQNDIWDRNDVKYEDVISSSELEVNSVRAESPVSLDRFDSCDEIKSPNDELMASP